MGMYGRKLIEPEGKMFYFQDRFGWYNVIRQIHGYMYIIVYSIVTLWAPAVVCTLSGLIVLGEKVGLTLVAPRKKITVLLIGNHSAGKSSFINWCVMFCVMYDQWYDVCTCRHTPLGTKCDVRVGLKISHPLHLSCTHGVNYTVLYASKLLSGTFVRSIN